MAKKTYSVICQKWDESERGWGNRPDGYSLHLTEEDRQQFIQKYWDGMPNEVPDEYSRPDGTAYMCPVSPEIWRVIKENESKHGIRHFGTSPYPGGVEGWVSKNPPMLTEVHCVKCWKAECTCHSTTPLR